MRDCIIILFITILFCLITFPLKRNLFTFRASFFFIVCIFIIISITINFFPLKYQFKISSFDKINYDTISQEAKLFYTNEFKKCIADLNKCYHPLSSKCYEDLDKKIICQTITLDQNEFEIFGKGEHFKIYLKQNKILIIAKFFISILFLSIFIYILKSIYIFKIRNKFELTFPISLILILFICS